MQLLRLSISTDHKTAPPDFLEAASSPGPTDTLSILDIPRQKCLSPCTPCVRFFLWALSKLLGETHG